MTQKRSGSLLPIAPSYHGPAGKRRIARSRPSVPSRAEYAHNITLTLAPTLAPASEQRMPLIYDPVCFLMFFDVPRYALKTSNMRLRSLNQDGVKAGVVSLRNRWVSTIQFSEKEVGSRDEM